MKTFYFAESWWQFIIMAVVCYLIGCFNFATIIARKRNKDITKIGSGNPGTMNMSREFGLGVGLLTFFCDALKGAVPLLVSYFLYRDYCFSGTNFVVSDFTRYFCGMFVIIGHIFPVTMGFKGGKGIASTLGLFWCSLATENLWWLFIGFLFLLVVVGFIAWTEMGSLASLFGVTGFSIMQMVIFFLDYGFLVFNAYMVCTFIFIFIVNILTWVAHHVNIARLFAGEEHHTSIRRLAKKKK